MTTKVTRGRPVCETKKAEQKAKLIIAAQHLLNVKSYSQITIREIAAEAKVNSAMIKYYFDSKEGLFVELIQALADEHFSQFGDLYSQARPVYHFMRQFNQILQTNPGFVHLLAEEILNKTTPLAQAFMSAFPERVSQFLPELITQEVGINDHKKAKLAAFSLMTQLVSPYIFKTLRQQAWQIEDADIQSEQRVKELYLQFIFGLKEQQTHEVEF